MLTAHHTVAFLVLGVTWGAGLFAGVAYYRRREPRGFVTHLLALAQTRRYSRPGSMRLPTGARGSPGSPGLPWWQERSPCGRT